MSNIKISVKGSTKRGEDFFDETNYLLSLSNFMEISLNFPHNNNFQEEIKFLQNLKEEKNTSYTVHAQYLDGNLSDFNEKIRGGSVEEVYYAIDTAEKLGADVVTLHPALDPYGLKIEERREIELDSYKKIASYAKEKNIKIGLENLAPDLLWIPERAYNLNLLLETVKEINSPNFGITLDIGHANTSKENYLEFIEKNHERIFHIHAHDNLGDTKKNIEKYNRPDPHLPPGEGNIDWEKVLEVLKKVNYQNYFMLECEINLVEKGLCYIENTRKQRE